MKSLKWRDTQINLATRPSPHYFAAVLFDAVFYKVALTKSVDEIPNCGHSNEIYPGKSTEQNFPLVLFIMLYKVALTFESCGKNSKVSPFK